MDSSKGVTLNKPEKNAATSFRGRYYRTALRGVTLNKPEKNAARS